MTDTHPLRSITVSGFRGILIPLKLDFESGSSIRSMVLYGRNGTGKSSITDAWEWLQAGKIDHLAKEGAGEASYPHLKAAKEQAYVEIEAVDSQLSGVGRRLSRSTGDAKAAEQRGLAALTNRAPHPCQIRFSDLTRFVYMTKADRYDLLAKLMGLDRQVRLAKKLRRVQKDVSDDVARRVKGVADERRELREALGAKSADSAGLLRAIKDICKVHEIDCAPTLPGAAEASESLRDLVEKDPRSSALADEKTRLQAIRDATVPATLSAVCSDWADWQPLEDAGLPSQDVAFVDLFDAASRLLSRPECSTVDAACPLCGRIFEGDLGAHVEDELARLRPVRDYVDTAARLRRDLSSAVTSLRPLVDRLPAVEEQTGAVEPPDNAAAELGLRQKGLLLIGCAELGVEAINRCCSDLSPTVHDSGLATRSELSEFSRDFESARSKCEGQCDARIRSLEGDEARSALVDDQSRVASAIKVLRSLELEEGLLQLATETETVMRTTTEAFATDCAADVRSRFDAISEDVADYFSVIEHHTEGLEKPALKFGEDQDRAVTLEVVFRGKAVSQAYAYLSESQLNSFGLAVFLASVRHFNSRFRFVLLDDVINSLDMQKRPALIELLKSRFDDFQVLLMTHDDIWREELRRSFPRWIHRRFNRLQYPSGPVMHDSPGSLERIEELIREDRPDEAGGVMGVYLERRLQDTCEAFEVLVTYRKDNAHTLEPLLDRLRVRTKEKLGADHALCRAFEDLQASTSFRNFCSHWKDQSTSITPEEMSLVLNHWKTIEQQVVCGDCARLLVYTDGVFRCGCGGGELRRADAARGSDGERIGKAP